ncbi:unnamed protein product [Periconia digitata]|uniref:Uncharacterized protein n=1 Tax=Periconia digitata TaxID=1303443 RepID=A0A9W4UMZ2_9PLEO|nr:unnamed protein product [Periconia digitata]
MDCQLSHLSKHTNGFDFGTFVSVYKELNETCLPESEIFFHGTRLLTERACEVITGNESGSFSAIWSKWTPYPIEDIWTRIVTWKLPLFQLVGQFPRSPLGFRVETATIFHVLGDPIDSIVSMFVTLAICHTRVEAAKKLCLKAKISPSSPEYASTWKRLAIIMVAYDDCGKGDEQLRQFRRTYLRLRKHPRFETEIRHIYEETADCLAADRQTKSLPVALAELFFIGGWIIALIKAAASNPSPTNWPNVEIHSVAFSGLYLWVTSSVAIASVIGVSQTEASIPRLLQGFEYHLDCVNVELKTLAVGDLSSSLFPSTVTETPTQVQSRRPSAAHREAVRWCSTGEARAAQGGLNAWRPTKWNRPRSHKISNLTMSGFIVAALVVVGASYVTAILLSYYVPPHGPGCRHIPETLMFVIWVASFILESLIEHWVREWRFWSVFTKDVFCALSNIAIVVVTQWGIMNRCSCWSMWGLAGLHLPHLPEVMPQLMRDARHVAPWIVSTAILFQMLFCGLIAWWYYDAVRVFIQRDDGISHSRWRRRNPGAEIRVGEV